MTEHELKTWPTPFAAVCEGRKRFEFRFNDRNYQVGDLLMLREWNPADGTYTGEEVLVEVLYILRDSECLSPQPGYCVMSIEIVSVSRS